MTLQLTSERSEIPDVEEASGHALSSGFVYVTSKTSVDSDVEPGKQVVLETANGYRELITTNQYDGTPGGPGTYLSTEDYKALSARNKPTLRLYGKSDTWKKRRSRAGLLVLAPAAIGLVAALLGLYFGAFGEAATSPGTVSDRAQSIVRWVSEATKPAVVRGRAVQARHCLDELAGHQTPRPLVPVASCSATSPPWWRNRETAAWVTLIVGALTAFLTVIATRGRFGFQRSPTG